MCTLDRNFYTKFHNVFPFAVRPEIISQYLKTIQRGERMKAKGSRSRGRDTLGQGYQR